MAVDPAERIWRLNSCGEMRSPSTGDQNGPVTDDQTPGRGCAGLPLSSGKHKSEQDSDNGQHYQNAGSNFHHTIPTGRCLPRNRLEAHLYASRDNLPSTIATMTSPGKRSSHSSC